MNTDRASGQAGPWPDVAIHPGRLLGETLAAKGITQTELALRTGRPVQALNEIISGRKAITPGTALELERVLGTAARIWLNLQRDYEFNKARLDDLERLRDQANEARAYPYAAMAALGWVAATRDALERVRELLRFFGVVHLSAVAQVQPVAYRKSRVREASPQALAAWLRKGEIEGAAARTHPFDAASLRASLPRMRAMTLLSPEQFHQPLCDLCAECGVAVVFVPHLPGTHVNGAVRWLSPERALVQLSVLHQYDDIFWFSLFHELGHPLLHGRKDAFVEVAEKQREPEDVHKEAEADKLAADTLIPPAQARRLKVLPSYSEASVRSFAAEIGVSPSIVVGRLQHEGLVPHSHLNHLRTKLEIRGC
jgi:HTH-type transcriptional regulator / antitoxin HigA